jgi:hypothetical protein
MDRREHLSFKTSCAFQFNQSARQRFVVALHRFSLANTDVISNSW